MQVRIEQTENKGRAYIGELPKPLAEMTFTMAGPDKMIIDHTSVSDELRGKGAGRQLLMALVEKARN
ncbi:MAG: GNAT family N-acetyltransferase, partial [Bacteroidetes bacterium]|nr:GNAT family N-acetyltransferase [Bacteroidota bacterium]